MTSKHRFLWALERKIPDRLPVTTHHVMESYLDRRLKRRSVQEFFDIFGLDPILWVVALRPDESRGERFDPSQPAPGFLQARRLCSDDWRIETESLSGSSQGSVRYLFSTPRKTLTMVLRDDGATTWVTERLIKDKSDLDIFARWAPRPLCDVVEVNRQAEAFGDRGMVRGLVPGFEVYGQSGCWQDAAVLFGIENLILETYSDPEWVRAFLSVLGERKQAYIRSMDGARFDLVEHGGGDASSTVISPRIFDEFVAPYDAPLIASARQAGQRVVYHTCGGMMPLLEGLADMGPEALETFTPRSMGGDAELREAKRRVGRRVCLIGGFDQFHFFVGCSPEETRREVRRCFEEAGEGGGYILAPSDHFFEAEPELLRAYSDEARRCLY